MKPHAIFDVLNIWYGSRASSMHHTDWYEGSQADMRYAKDKAIW